MHSTTLDTVFMQKKKFRQEHISNRVHVLQKLIPGGAKMVRWKPLDEAAD
jgi:hypothetical protein